MSRAKIGSGRVLLAPSAIRYLLCDEFTTDRAAGSVNGTAAEPGPGTRVAVDTNSKLSVSGDSAIFSAAGLAVGDPGLWYASMTRTPGTFLVATITYSSQGLGVGFDSGQTSTIQDAVTFNGSSLGVRANGTAIVVGASATGQQYRCIVALRAIGTAFLVVGGAFAYPTLIYINDVGTGNRFPAVGCLGTTSVAECLSIRIPADLWLPAPLVSDGFGSSFGTSDGLGHAETTGIGSGGGNVAWTQQVGTWGISSGKAVATALSGGEAIATVPLSTANPFVGIDLARSAGNVGGVARWTDSSNHLRWYHDGTNHVLQQVVSGTPTTLIAAAATYGANAKSWLWLNGTSARLYYNNTLTGSTSSINAGLTAANAGIRTTNTGNTQDNFVAYAVGAEGQYNLLNQY